MKATSHIFLVTLITVCGATELLAQRKDIYLFGAANRPRSGSTGPRIVKLANAGLGFDIVKANGFGVGLEGGVFNDVIPEYSGALFGSINLLYQHQALERLKPFGTVGATGAIDPSGDAKGNGGFNFGGGANYWIFEQLAVRLEYRGYSLKHCSGGGCTKNTFRFGVAVPF